MTIYLIRHTKVNVKSGICYGQSDVDLADSFVTEATNIHKEIYDINFDKIYSSPLTRCKQLAEFLFDQEIIFDDRLKELNFGDWEMQNWDDINGPIAEKWMNDFVNTPCPNGESFIDLFNRTKGFLTEIRKLKSKNLAIITHGGPIRSLLAFINDKKLNVAFKRDIKYGQIIKLDI